MPQVDLTIRANDKASGVIKGVAGSISGAMIGLKVAAELFKKFGEIGQKAFEMSKASGGDFAKVMGNMKKTQEEVMMVASKLFATVGKDLVKGFDDAAKGIKEFLNNSQVVGNISAAFELMGNIVKDLVKVLSSGLKDTVTSIMNSFKQLSEQTGGTVDQFTFLAGIVEIVKLAINSLFNAIQVTVQLFVNFVSVLIEAGKTLGAFYDLLQGKKTWKEVQEQMGKTGDSVMKLGKDLTEGITKQFKLLVNGAQEFGNKTGEAASKMKTDYIKKQEETAKAHAKIQDEMLTKEKENNDKEEKDNNDTEDKKRQKILSNWKLIQDASINATNSISGFVMQMAEMVNDQNKEMTQEKLDLVDQETQKKLEFYGLQELSKQEQLGNELDILTEQLGRSVSEEEQANLQSQISAKQDELKKTQIMDEGEKKKAEINKKALQQEYERKVAAFNAQKAIDIVAAGAQMALGIASAAASGATFAQASVVMIPLLIGLVAAAGIASIATIASKQPPPPPAFAEGVTNFSGGVALVGERGPELVTLPGGSNVITNDNFSRMGGGSINITNMTVQTNDPRDFARQLTELRRYEFAR